MRSRRSAAAALSALAASGLLLAGCGSGGENTDTSANKAAGGEAARAPAAGNDLAEGATDSGGAGRAANGSTNGGAAAGTSALARVAPQDRQLIRTADVSVQVPDMRTAVAGAKRQVSAAGGMVYSEQLERAQDNAATMSDRLTFKVPPAAFDRLVDALSALGPHPARTSSTEDVTDQVVDVAARIRSQQQSVDRVRALLARADTLGEVVQVESELTRRISDLEALEARQKSLSEQVATSTITLTLSGPGQPVTKAEKKEARHAGFVWGLRGGWHAFAVAAGAALTALGAALPFLVLLALAWLPARRLVRHARRRLAASGGIGVPPREVSPPAAGPAPSA